MTLSTYTLALFIHILAAMVLVGSSLFAPQVRRAIQSAGSVAELRGWLDLGRRSARANPLAAIALLGTGIWLGKDGWWAEPWFWVAIVAWIVNATLAAAVVRRAAAEVALTATRVGADIVWPEVHRLRRSRSWAIAEGVMGANDVALLYVMIDKPSLGQSVAILALANLAVLGAKRVRELHQHRAPRAGQSPSPVPCLAEPEAGASPTVAEL